MGQHAQEGTIDGFIAHTNSGFTALRVNGQPTGEIEQAGWLAGYFGVPLIFVSGDEAAVREAIGEECTLRVDCNQGYRVSEAVKMIRDIEPYGVEMIEQPTIWWENMISMLIGPRNARQSHR